MIQVSDDGQAIGGLGSGRLKKVKRAKKAAKKAAKKDKDHCSVVRVPCAVAACAIGRMPS